MGVERQSAKVNWITSFAMIVAAGTLFRAKRMMKHISNTQIRDLLIRFGLINRPIH